MKKLLALLLAVVMVVGVLSTVAVADEAETYTKMIKAQETAVVASFLKLAGDAATAVKAEYKNSDATKTEITDAIFAAAAAKITYDAADKGNVKKNFDSDWKAFLKAANDGWKAFGDEYAAQLTQAMADQLVYNLTEGADVDQAVLDVIDSLPGVNS